MQNNPLLRAFVLASLETVHERLDAEIKAQAAAEAKAKKQAAARAKIEAKARAEAEASARARAEAEAEARAAAELMRQIEAELRARAEAERVAQEAEARAQAEADAKARADAEAAEAKAKAEGKEKEKARVEAESETKTGAAAVTIPWSPSAFAQGLGHPYSSVDEPEIETWNFGGATDANASIEADAGSDINMTVVAPPLRAPPPRTTEPDETPRSAEATEPAESPPPSVEAPRPRFRTYVTPRGSLKARASNEPPVFTALRTWLLSDTARKRRADAKKSPRTFTPPTRTATPQSPSPKLPPLRAGEGLRTIIRRVVSEEVGELSRAVAERVPFEASDSPRSSPGLETVEQYIQRTGHAPGNAEPAGVSSQPAESDSPSIERESPAAAEKEPPALRDVVLPRPPEEIFPLDFCAADGSHIHDPEWDDDMEPPPTEDDIVIDDGDPDDDPDPELLVSAGRWNNP